MANYTLTNKAVEDLSNIWNYSFEAWSESQEILGFRIGQHIIFYRKLKGKKVEIVRILHSRMDLKNKIWE